MSSRPELLHSAGPPQKAIGSRSARTDREPSSSPGRNEIGEFAPASHRSKRGRKEAFEGESELQSISRVLKKAAADPRASAFDVIAKAIQAGERPNAGDTVIDVVQRGDDVFELYFAWGPPMVLDVAALSSPLKWVQAMIRSRRRIPRPMTREELRFVSQAILDCARIVRTVSEKEETISWIGQCVNLERDVLELRHLERAAHYRTGSGHAGWREGEEVVVRLVNLVATLAELKITRIRQSELAARLGRCGFENLDRGFRFEGRVVHARVWVCERSEVVQDGFDDDAEILDSSDPEARCDC